jgi:hypothetical protein
MNTGFQYPAEYSLPAAKKMKLDNGIDLLQQHPELAYPDTDQQYATPTTATPSAMVLPEGVSQEQYLQAWASYAQSLGYSFPPQIGAENVTAASSSTSSVVPSSPSLEEKPAAGLEASEQKAGGANAPSGEWVEVLDDETGATYYYNPQTGESSWGLAPAEEADRADAEEEEQGKGS